MVRNEGTQENVNQQQGTYSRFRGQQLSTNNLAPKSSQNVSLLLSGCLRTLAEDLPTWFRHRSSLCAPPSDSDRRQDSIHSSPMHKVDDVGPSHGSALHTGPRVAAGVPIFTKQVHGQPSRSRSILATLAMVRIYTEAVLDIFTVTKDHLILDQGHLPPHWSITRL